MLANGMRLNDRCAPRGALSYRRFSRRELEGRFLGPMAYPVTERFRGQEHARKSAAGSRCQGRRVGRTRVTWRRLDCLNPNLQKMQVHIHRNDTRNRCRSCPGFEEYPGQPSGPGAMSSEDIQGDEWGG